MSSATNSSNSEPGATVSCIGQGLLSISQVPDLHRLRGIRSLCLHGNNLTRIEGLQDLAELVELNLSSNAIASIDPGSLRGLSRLTSLNLASNRLPTVQGLDGLSSLEHLNLSYNYITSITGLSALQGPLCKLRQLNLKHNQLHNLQSFSVLVGCISLRWLQVAGNPVCQLPNYLQALATVLTHVTQLDALSSAEALAAPYDMQAAQQYAAMRLQSFDPAPLPQLAQQPAAQGTPRHVPPAAAARPAVAGAGKAAGLAPPPAYQAQSHDSVLASHQRGSPPLRRAVPPPSFPPPPPQQHPQQQQQTPPQGPWRSHGLQTPRTLHHPQQQNYHDYHHVSAGPDGPGDLQAGYSAAGPPAAAAPPPPHHSQQPSQQGQTRAPANWQATRRAKAGGGGSGDSSDGDVGSEHLSDACDPPQQHHHHQHGGETDVLPATDQRQPPASSQQQQQHVQHQLQPPARVVKVLLADAAAQTSEYTPLVRRLQVEAVELRQQLSTLTDELAKRNAAEEGLRVAMQEAVVRAQEEAHRKVEEGFREASFAVSKALQELESARHAASEAQQRVAAHVRSEEEQRSRCAGLEKDVARLREELQRLNQQLLDQQQSAAAGLEDERRRAAATEAAVREQLAAAQAAAAELPVLRAAVQAAEQKVSSLESALQQSSSVTVSMTAKIAQTMSDANAQIDLLKSRLASAEQQLADHQRREVDSRAEINTLTTALQAARTQHDRELEAAARQQEEAVKTAVEKERAAAEERGKAMAALQAQQERSGLQEQIAFLKVQLQFALKESDREQQTAHQVLQTAQAEASELRSALQAAVAKQREGEALVSDFTSVVQQQKAAIQALQREKEALAARLKACGPEAFDALAAENLGLKRAAAERDLCREQADDARRRWKEAERRINELQASSARTAEELASKVRAAEAALAAAREEASRAAAVAESLRQEVSTQQDIVKVKVKMLDSANETIASLKAERDDLQVEAEEARRAAEEAEMALSREQEQREEEDGEKVQLRQEAQASEAAAAAARTALAEAQARLKEVEGRLRTATEEVVEKDRVIKYVEEEVDRVKGLFEKREQRLRDERDAARADAEMAAAARDTAEARLAESGARLERLARELEHARGQLEDAAAQLEEQQRAAVQAEEQAAARGVEVQRLTARVAEVEGEMRQLLEAVERQKVSSAHKMRQLASLLQEL
ncbi:hypothetical protein Agub_g4909 [Astrephomene gubernaculifera]|uniref:Uncharacterized protein n=1 Tax=Astrephomene gubernaculifera TaxID=47775 RepID=A0AAD3HK56_9CHLO|nr:hypothetical protein Agub_g4909 [Astrephomene gubernaculifera]